MLLSTFLHRFLCGCVFVCLGSGVAGSCDNSLFSHLRNCQIALLSIYYFTFTVDEGSSFQLFLKQTFRQCLSLAFPVTFPVTTEAPAGFVIFQCFSLAGIGFCSSIGLPLSKTVCCRFPPFSLFLIYVYFFLLYPFALISMRFQDVLEVSSCVQSASLNWKFLQFLLY